MASSSDIENMRSAISKVYGPEASSWIIRCKNMSDRQVIAIYLRMKEKGKFDKRRKKVKEINKKNESYRQLTLWDYGIDL